MGEEMKCLLFRRRGSSGMGKRIGQCDIDGESTVHKYLLPNSRGIYATFCYLFKSRM